LSAIKEHSDYPFMIANELSRGTAIIFACYALAQVRADGERQGERKMIRTVFAMAVAAFLLAIGGGTSQAAPIAPLASVATGDSSLVTPVWWHRHRHCWRGRYGHVHCRW
jgi:hypothetical protein